MDGGRVLRAILASRLGYLRATEIAASIGQVVAFGSEFPVVDSAGLLVGVLSRGDLIRALKTLGPDARIADAMTKDVPTISHRACLEEAIRLLQEKRAPAVGVVDTNGKFAGLITSETIGEMLMA